MAVSGFLLEKSHKTLFTSVSFIIYRSCPKDTHSMTATPTDCRMEGFQSHICFSLSLEAGMLLALFVSKLRIKWKQGLPTQAGN